MQNNRKCNISLDLKEYKHLRLSLVNYYIDFMVVESLSRETDTFRKKYDKLEEEIAAFHRKLSEAESAQ